MDFRKKQKVSWIAAIGIALMWCTSGWAKPGGVYWVQFGPLHKNLPEVGIAIARLPQEIRKDLSVCITNGDYAVVHGKFGPRDKTERLQFDIEERLKAMAVVEHSFKPESDSSDPGWQLSLAQYDKRGCYSAVQYMDNTKPKKATPRSTKPVEKVKTGSMPPVSQTTPEKKIPAITEPRKSVSPKTEAIQKSKSTPHESKKRSKRKAAGDKSPKPGKTEIIQKAEAIIYPEVTTRVVMSNRDMNRIVCQGDNVKDVISSEEKHVIRKWKGHNAFVKFQVAELPGGLERIYPREPVELFVICGEDSVLYPIIAEPSDVPAQTIRLADNREKVRRNLEHFKGMSLEVKVLEIMRQAYQGEYPDSYDVSESPGRIVTTKVKKPFTITTRRTVEIEGEGLRLREYVVTLSSTNPENRVEVEERDFLVPELTTRPVAIMVDPLSVGKDVPTRLFIIERRNTLVTPLG